MKLSNLVKKWKERKDELENPINGVIVKGKKYLKSKDKGFGFNKD